MINPYVKFIQEGGEVLFNTGSKFLVNDAYLVDHPRLELLDPPYVTKESLLSKYVGPYKNEGKIKIIELIEQ